MKKWGECNGADVILHESWASNEIEPVWAIIIYPAIEYPHGGFIYAYEIVGELGHEWIVRLSKLTLELVPLRCVAITPKSIYIVRAANQHQAIEKVPMDDKI